MPSSYVFVCIYTLIRFMLIKINIGNQVIRVSLECLMPVMFIFLFFVFLLNYAYRHFSILTRYKTGSNASW